MTPLLVVLFLIALGVGIVALAIGLIDVWRREALRTSRGSDLDQAASQVPEPGPVSAATATTDPFAHVDVLPEPRP